jgi:hypothetical protein
MFADQGLLLMVNEPLDGKRQLISDLDVLLVAEFSSVAKVPLGLALPPPW